MQFFMLWLVFTHTILTDILAVSRFIPSRLAATKPFDRLRTGSLNPFVSPHLGFGLDLGSFFRAPSSNPFGAVVYITVPKKAIQ